MARGHESTITVELAIRQGRRRRCLLPIQSNFTCSSQQICVLFDSTMTIPPVNRAPALAGLQRPGSYDFEDFHDFAPSDPDFVEMLDRALRGES